jgi:diaminopimelate epimerase
MAVRFCKYSALGNEYLVLAQPRFADHLNESNVRHICDSDNGPGADGVLAVYSPPGGVGVHIWNADGSKAEKSGNGLRIFARYLWDRGDVGDDPVHILTAGGEVQAIVLDRGNRVRVEMGQVTVQDDPLVIRTDPEEVLECTPASVGNPHCVCFVDAPTAQLARSLGPSIERHEAFPNRTNVQFVSVISRSEIRMEVWERGSG